jgi:uncharacterized protein YqiB (DUF1249 family)
LAGAEQTFVYDSAGAAYNLPLIKSTKYPDLMQLLQTDCCDAGTVFNMMTLFT